MTWKDMSVLAVIPARGGSKGIPRKNLHCVGPLSLIGWAARTVSELSWIDCAILSTDDLEMAQEGRSHGLEVPFTRPQALSTDTATAAAMWRHAWLEGENTYGQHFDISILLQPTTPLRLAADVERTVSMMVDGGHCAAATVSPIPGHFSPEKNLMVDEQGILKFSHKDGASYTSRQMLQNSYYRNGVCYAATRHSLIDNGNIVEADCLAVIVDDYIVNIDDPIELEIARMLYTKLEHQKST